MMDPEEDYEFQQKLDDLDARIERNRERLKENGEKLEQLRIDAIFLQMMMHIDE